MATTTQVLVYSVLSSLLAAITVRAEDVCSYVTYGYNEYDRRYERMVSFKKCQWGCCWKYTSPCCTPPVGLIVGCVIGGFVCLVVLIGCLCCCCGYCHSRRGSGSRAAPSQRPPGPHVVYYPDGQGGNNVRIGPLPVTPLPTNNSDSAISTSLPPGVYQPPPSYEEVMAGEINPVFKPDEPPSYEPPQ